MGDAARNLLDEALSLPEDERELLALDLFASLETPEPEWEAAWAAEIERRLAEVRSGEVQTVPWEEVEREILARLRSR